MYLEVLVLVLGLPTVKEVKVQKERNFIHTHDLLHKVQDLFIQ